MKRTLLGFGVLLVFPLLLVVLCVRALLEIAHEIGLRTEMWWDDLPFVKWKHVCRPCYELRMAQGAHWSPDHRPEDCPHWSHAEDDHA